jgi:hypothetical protein
MRPIERSVVGDVLQFMKRILSFTAVVGVAIIVAEIIYSNFTRPTLAPGRVNGLRILAAARFYARDLQAHGQVVPATAPLHDLIAKGLLRPEDVSGFSGPDVSVSLTAVASHPRDVLMRVRMQDGSQIVVLADGSVHLAGSKVESKTSFAPPEMRLVSDDVNLNALPSLPNN